MILVALRRVGMPQALDHDEHPLIKRLALFADMRDAHHLDKVEKVAQVE